MFTSLLLQGFQAHRNLRVKFTRGVNVIVGPSDVGKSSILRALYWVCFNKPSGNSMCNWETEARGEETVVVLATEEGDTIVRAKGPGSNKYLLNDNQFTGFGQNVPDAVKIALNIGEINFLRQIDGPFLIGKSPGEVGRVLNEVAHLDIIDVAHSGINSCVRKNNIFIEKTEQSIIQQQELINNLPDLTFAKKVLKELRGLDEELEKIIAAQHKLEDLCSSIQRLEVSISHPRYAIIGLEEGIDEAISLLKEVEEIEKKVDVIWTQRALILDLQQRVAELTDMIHGLEEEFKENFPDVCPLCGQEVSNES